MKVAVWCIRALTVVVLFGLAATWTRPPQKKTRGSLTSSPR